MGGTSYSLDSRATRSLAMGYQQATSSPTDSRVFRQNALRKVNEGMDPAQITWREARDSVVHPYSFPIVLQLDETGSMGAHPANLVKGDLPHLMGHLIEGECPDAALLFMAVGDLYSDQAPLQIGQFESGDAELDHWLTSVWLEADGGGNGGESYSLGWLFAMNLIGTDAWDKRGEKGLFIGIGDEPLHENMPVDKLKKLFGAQFTKVTEGLEFGADVSVAQVLAKVREKWDIHQINVGVTFSDNHKRSWAGIGEGYHEIGRHDSIVDKVREIIKSHMATCKNCKAPVAGAPSPERARTPESPLEEAGDDTGPTDAHKRPTGGAGQSIPEPL